MGNDEELITLSRSEKAWSKNHIQVDLLSNEFQLPEFKNLNHVFIILAPSERTEVAYRRTYIDAVSNLLAALKKQTCNFHCTFLSATSVFGLEQLGIIDEKIKPLPDNFRGEVLLEAEKNIQDKSQSFSIVRASGLFSIDRMRLVQSVLFKEQFNNPKWLNLIHDDDLCHWIYTASKNAWPLSIASDGEPFQRKEVQGGLNRQKDNQFRQFKSQYFNKVTLQHHSFASWLSVQEF